jgi:PBP1b-binding outer membrane lipoprotein LpoB
MVIRRIIMNKYYALSLMFSVAVVSGCMTPPSSPYVPATEVGVVTVGMDEKDYQLMANSVVQKMLKKGLPAGYVVALGPIDTKKTPYEVDCQKLQDMIESAMSDEGTLKFTSAVNAIAGNTATEEIYKLIEYNYFIGNPIDSEDMQKFGKIAKVTGILFGRVSSIERSIGGNGKEITYTFTWRLSNTKTGINEVTHTDYIRKNIK